LLNLLSLKDPFLPHSHFHFINIIYTLILYSKKKNKDAYFLLFSTIILGSSVILDIISDRGFIQLPRTVGFVFILFHSTVGLILVNRFVRMKEELKEVNSKLEEKVLLRTNELSVSLNEVNELKLKQDADYFLINLLVDPLSINLNNSKNVSSEIHVNQKKKFDFRKRNYQIGGDLCLCQNIKINGKNFTFFVNADAMGKSIQGAGGALVLGVLLRTILTRSKNIIINFSIEKWMENLFNELQNTFESFDGSMLISAFIGLIDDYSGKLTYINAENPGTVLYRDNNAFFLDTSSLSRKFGTPDNIFSPGSIQLKCSDILICGSDGRDDILLEKGNKLSMNQDENLFLKKVEESKGQLFSLVYNIMKTGELTDDFSLIKIQYKSPFYNINEDLYPKQSLNFEEKELTYSL
ncbi:MAG: serine/threonine-protein phosphatase, partial [Leptospiraceae bacterium]|nr:serine/threonine-protein phosphatase [Leptospiraceae bacterium]